MILDLVIVLLLLYLLFVILLLINWIKIPAFSIKKALIDPPFISVVVSVRNEVHNLPLLIKSLYPQSYKNFELIVVDDHSTDGTDIIAEELLKGQENFRYKIIRMSELGKEGKKQAINRGIKESSGEIIICTDGDCQAGPRWIETVAHYFVEHNYVMVTGGVAFINDGSIFSKLQDLEFTSLIGTGAACLEAGFPNMCNGANLAYRKGVFYEVNGYQGNENVASGDDEFLMHKVWEKYPGKVKFLKNADHLIYTRSNADVLSFFYQRRRWASKWDAYKLNSIKYIAFFVFISNLSFIVSLIIILSGGAFKFFLAGLLLAKIGFEYALINKVFRDQKRKADFKVFLFLQLIHPFYIVIFGLISKIGNYKWKGRTFK